MPLALESLIAGDRAGSCLEPPRDLAGNAADRALAAGH
jgi:hypothetical protein